jgi:hypothetical protein
MQLFMGQADTVGGAHFIMDSFDHTEAAFDAVATSIDDDLG